MICMIGPENFPWWIISKMGKLVDGGGGGGVGLLIHENEMVDLIRMLGDNLDLYLICLITDIGIYLIGLPNLIGLRGSTL